MPVLTPKALASYEEVIMHDPCLPLVTATGIPNNSENLVVQLMQKNAFMST